MSDEIREKFEVVFSEISHEIGSNGDYSRPHTRAEYDTFLKGHKSRDEEVLTLTFRVAVAEGKNVELEAEKKELTELNQMHYDYNMNYVLILHEEKQLLMYERNDLKAKNEKLREALEEVGNVLYQDTDGIGDLNEARRIIKQALKDGE